MPLHLALAAFPALLAVLAGDPPAPTSPPAAAPATQKAPTDAAKPVYDENADAHAAIDAALAAATRDHSRVLLQWGANWCGWCKLLHGTFASDKEIAKKLRDEYVVVYVDVGRMDKNADLAKRFNADLAKNGLPYLTVLDSSGAVVANQETGSLELPKGTEPRGHDRAKVLDFLTKNQAPPAKADDVLAAGLAKASSEGKLVFLHFGAPWCGWCHRLENWMAKPDVHAILAKAFVDVKIDTDRMTGGQELLTKHAKGKNGGVPWFEIVDASGAALVNSNAPSGNVGFPAQPGEIGWFVEMLTRSNAKLSSADIAALKSSLEAESKPAAATPSH